MKRAILALALAMALFCMTGCAKKAVEVKADKPEIPLAPEEGLYLAKAAEKVPISNGPSTPIRKVLSQEPRLRPCWAVPDGKGCPMDKPGTLFFVGTSSGAATKDGAILNAYQNAIETLAKHCLALTDEKSTQKREIVRAKAYLAAGIHDKNYRLMNSTWSQKWEERYRDYMRVYYRAFVLLFISETEARQISS